MFHDDRAAAVKINVMVISSKKRVFANFLVLQSRCGVKMSTAQQEPTVAGQRNIEVLCEKFMPICLSTAHRKVRDSSKRFELMLFFSGSHGVGAAEPFEQAHVRPRSIFENLL